MPVGMAECLSSSSFFPAFFLPFGCDTLQWSTTDGPSWSDTMPLFPACFFIFFESCKLTRAGEVLFWESLEDVWKLSTEPLEVLGEDWGVSAEVLGISGLLVLFGLLVLLRSLGVLGVLGSIRDPWQSRLTRPIKRSCSPVASSESTKRQSDPSCHTDGFLKGDTTQGISPRLIWWAYWMILDSRAWRNIWVRRKQGTVSAKIFENVMMC